MSQEWSALGFMVNPSSRQSSSICFCLGFMVVSMVGGMVVRET